MKHLYFFFRRKFIRRLPNLSYQLSSKVTTLRSLPMAQQVRKTIGLPLFLLNIHSVCMIRWSNYIIRGRTGRSTCHLFIDIIRDSRNNTYNCGLKRDVVCSNFYRLVLVSTISLFSMKFERLRASWEIKKCSLLNSTSSKLFNYVKTGVKSIESVLPPRPRSYPQKKNRLLPHPQMTLGTTCLMLVLGVMNVRSVGNDSLPLSPWKYHPTNLGAVPKHKRHRSWCTLTNLKLQFWYLA